MNYIPGKYIILKDTYWTICKAQYINIVEVDKTKEIILYYYDSEEFIRERKITDFLDITLALSSPLMEELL